MDYFIIENNTQQGPFSLEQLAQRHLTSETLVWTEGMADWTPAWRVEELIPILNGSTTKPVTPPPFYSSSNESENHTEPTRLNSEPVGPDMSNSMGNDSEKQNGRAARYALIFAIVILVLMFITNPNKDTHTDAIHQEVTEAVENMSSTRDNNIFSQGIGMIGRFLQLNIFDEALGQMLSYHNYGAFSTCTIEFNGRSHRVSFGLLGHVWTMNSDDIERAINSNSSLKMISGTQDDVPSNGSSNNQNGFGQSEDNTVKEKTPAEDQDSVLEQYVTKQTDKTIKHVKGKIKNAIKNKMSEVSDSTAHNSLDQWIDKILGLIGL